MNTDRAAEQYSDYAEGCFQSCSYQEAFNTSQAAITNNPTVVDAWLINIASLLAMGRSANALQTAKNALLVIQHQEIYLIAGMIAGVRRDFQEAFKFLSSALAAGPENADVYYNIAVLYGVNGDYIRAMVNFEEAVRINPRHSAAYKNLAWAYTEHGWPEKAKECLNAAYNVSGKIPEDARKLVNFMKNTDASAAANGTKKDLSQNSAPSPTSQARYFM